MSQIKEVFTGELWMQAHNQDTRKYAQQNGINVIEGRGGQGLGDEFVYHGSNSGHQALNLAYVLSRRMGEIPKHIYLLGFDMGATGQTHWFGLHPDGWVNGNYAGFKDQFDKIAAQLKALGVEVINLTRETNLTQFKRATIDDI